MEITSTRNPLLQTIRKAVSSGRPTEKGLVVAEGPHLVEEALRGAWRVAQVVTTPEGRNRYADLLQRIDAEVVDVAGRAFESVSETRHSQQILALLEPRSWNWEDLALGRQALVVALDGIQDPGNAGTMIRSAEAFGATGVVLLRGSAHVSNGKLLRASAGSIFRLPFLEAMSVAELLVRAEASGLVLYALDAAGATPITAADFTAPAILVAGNEGSGVSPELRRAATRLSIPTAGVESINAAVALSIALFVAQQQRADA